MEAPQAERGPARSETGVPVSHSESAIAMLR